MMAIAALAHVVLSPFLVREFGSGRPVAHIIDRRLTRLTSLLTRARALCSIARFSCGLRFGVPASGPWLAGWLAQWWWWWWRNSDHGRPRPGAWVERIAEGKEPDQQACASFAEEKPLHCTDSTARRR